MKSGTIENRIKKKYGSVVNFFENYKKAGLNVLEISDVIGCSVSNLRRIARKNGILLEPCNFKKEPLINKDKRFVEETLNSTNFLSRLWLNNAF